MTEDRRLSTSDLVDAAGRAEARHAAVADDRPDPDAPRDRREDERTGADEPLFDAADADGYRTRWGAIQTGFVDEPRRAVEEADALVAEVVKRLAEGFAGTRQRLETEWERNDQVSTEDLRQSMRRYRSFFDRLLRL
jgi:hypothetical protein